MKWLDSGERVEDLREIRAHVYLSGFIGNSEVTDPCRIRDREREKHSSTTSQAENVYLHANVYAATQL